MQRGDRVEVLEAFDGKQVKIVVEWDDKIVYVCRESEYLRANAERREPNSTGFGRQFVRQLDED